MRKLPLAVLPLVPCLLALAPSGKEPSAFDASFVPKTMRVDLAHTGGPGGEVIGLSRVVSDGPWGGSTTRLVDDTNLGTYWFGVVDPDTNRLVFSRGYSSLYGEWETTSEPKKTTKTLTESLRFPWPKKRVQVVVKRRDKENLFKEVASFVIDPADVNPAALAPEGKVVTVFENGPATQKVDLLILGDGYTEAEMPKFRADVKRLSGVLFETEPFKSRKSDFNLRAIELPTKESGITRRDGGRFRRNRLGTQYGIFGSERYVLTYDEPALRDVASAAPYEYVEILVNDARYGGGGIYGDQATASVDSAFTNYLFVHEFGHHFAGLADEYYTSDVAYETGAPEKVEPWEPNVTALHDPAHVKWQDLVAAGTPLPTPWDKETFETESRKIQTERHQIIAAGGDPAKLDALFTRELKWSTPFLGSMKWSGKVGAFEGAAYEAKGLYRPAADCMMFTRDEVGFCPVCRRAIERVIDVYSRP
jgi:hypothetical protein